MFLFRNCHLNKTLKSVTKLSYLLFQLTFAQKIRDTVSLIMLQSIARVSKTKVPIQPALSQQEIIGSLMKYIFHLIFVLHVFYLLCVYIELAHCKFSCVTYSSWKLICMMSMTQSWRVSRMSRTTVNTWLPTIVRQPRYCSLYYGEAINTFNHL